MVVDLEVSSRASLSVTPHPGEDGDGAATYLRLVLLAVQSADEDLDVPRGKLAEDLLIGRHCACGDANDFFCRC